VRRSPPSFLWTNLRPDRCEPLCEVRSRMLINAMDLAEDTEAVLLMT